MAHFSSFEYLEVYKEATVFCDDIWDIHVTTPLQKDYKFREQINGSSGSVTGNIAVGFGYGGNKEFIMFLGFLRGSCSESKAQLISCHRRQHISDETYQNLSKKAQNLIDLLSKFINNLKNSDKKGPKFD
jgi:four helix bundle protein